MATIQGIYIALFGRPADPGGLAYWNGVTNNGSDLSKLIGQLTASQEYLDRFKGKSNAEIVTTIYQSLFGRTPDATGLDFFTKGLADGTLKLETLAINILDGAQGSDKTIIDNKTAAADLFTHSLDTPAEIAAYNGNAAAELGRAFLTKVTDDKTTIPSQTDVDKAVTGVVTPSGGQAPGGGGGGGGTDPAGPTTITLDSHFKQTFDGSLSNTWYVDRKAPAGFETATEDGRTILKQTISEDDRDSTASRNTQGEKIDVPGMTQVVSIELYVPEAWKDGSGEGGVRRAGFWGTTFDKNGDVAGYPIIEFYNGGFHFWDSTGSGAWSQTVQLPENFQFDAWHTLKMEIGAGGTFKYTVDGTLTFTVNETTDSVEFGNVILQGYNLNFGTTTDADGESYEIHWDSLSTGPTVYLTENQDLRGVNANFASNYVHVENGVTLTMEAAKAAGMEFSGSGTVHLTNAANADFSTSRANLQVDGTSGNDVIKGGSGSDTLAGGAGNDLIWGDSPDVTATIPAKYGDDSIDGGLGTNVLVLGTKAQDIQLGGQDTIQIVKGQQGDDVVFNFNFGPTGRYDDIRPGGDSGVNANSSGADLTFDKVKLSGGYTANDLTIKIGNDNDAYLDKVSTVVSGATVNGNTIATGHGDIYTGPSSGSEFEIVIEFAGGGSVTFANAMSRWEKAGFLQALGIGTGTPSQDGSVENNALDGLTYADGSLPTDGLVTLTQDQATALIGMLVTAGNLEGLLVA